jgi:hypothetical protein
VTLDPPRLPVERLEREGWARIEDSEDRLAELPVVDVQGRTLVYGDDHTRERIADATGIDQPWRFLFATRLSLSPSPPPGAGTNLLGSIVRPNAREGFAERLRERGYSHVEERGRDRLRVRTGERAHLTRYGATDSLSVEGERRSLPVEGYLAVWHHDAFFVAGGAYPASDLATLLDTDADVDLDPADCKRDLLSLLREIH